MTFNDIKLAGDLIRSADWNDFIAFAELISSNTYGFSSNARTLFAPSALTKCGYSNISSGDTISHGLSRIPAYANVSPSGMIVNFGATCRLDSTNITAYLTVDGNRDVFWIASL